MAYHRDDGYDTFMPGHNDHLEYVVDPFFSAGFGESGEMLYKVCWFGYGPENDQWEPREKIPPSFINRYWSKVGHTERDLKVGRIPGYMFSARPL